MKWIRKLPLAAAVIGLAWMTTDLCRADPVRWPWHVGLVLYTITLGWFACEAWVKAPWPDGRWAPRPAAGDMGQALRMVEAAPEMLELLDHSVQYAFRMEGSERIAAKRKGNPDNDLFRAEALIKRIKGERAA